MALCRGRIATGNRREDRLERHLRRLFELRSFGFRDSTARSIFVERQPGDDAANLYAVQRLALEQAFSQANHRLAILLDDLLRTLELRRDDLFHFLLAL